ncbi:uncharacterized protein LOC122368647 [Amphibalanus amphitrite]|uniref:uncharacterized protein LOC122368647 n=1 Tax=Amphibalanus amphitrite TaxID=1232801 RepID=UPI001C8FDCB0|nr:uncharacterized protein LOC122368647 [Amphibalanus amphitrite]
MALPRSAAAARVALVASLLAVVCPQLPTEQPFTCLAEGGHLVCRDNGTRVEFRSETATWREAHALCRRRGAFLVPSRRAFNSVILDRLYQRAAGHGDFWLGARYLRNGYYEWLLQMSDSGQVYYEEVGRSSSAYSFDHFNLCQYVTVVDNELEADWLPCEETRRVVCFSNDATDDEVRSAGYLPSMTAVYDDRVIQLGPKSDEVLLLNRAALQGDFELILRCGPGDSIVKDHFILGKTQYVSRWWLGNFTITRQMFPQPESSALGVGTYWCQRYVEGTVDPAVSGRLHLTSSEDLQVLTVAADGAVRALQLLLSDDSDYDYGSGYLPDEVDGLGPDDSSGTFDILEQLRVFLRSGSPELNFLAVYEFTGRQVTPNSASDEFDDRQRRRTVSILVGSSSPLNGSLLHTANITSQSAASRYGLRDVFNCAEEEVQDHVWRQSSNSYGFVTSEPACVVPGLNSFLRRQCKPSFGREGAQWGPFCAAGDCSSQPFPCQPPPPACPPGFIRSGMDRSEFSSELLCSRLVTGVTFQGRTSACRQQHPSAVPWHPRRRLLELSFISPAVFNHTLWLPFRRLWSLGAFLPDVLGLLSRDDRAVANLNASLDCAAVTPRGWLVSSACTDRHAVLCVTRPLYSQAVQPSQSILSARGRPCQTVLGLGARSPGDVERCFAFLCPATESQISWSEASSLCTDSNSSLASLTSQRQLDALVRFGRALERPARVAVNLKRHSSRLVWGDGTPLSYPALASDASTSGDQDRGILDISRGLYDIVESDQAIASCALCHRYIHAGPPEIVLFYEGPSIFANVTGVQRLVVDLEKAISCFTSTSRETSSDYSPTKQFETEQVRDEFMVSRMQILPSMDDRAFIQIFPSVDFGYLTCGLLINETGEQITSNSLTLLKQSDGPPVQEYVIGLKGALWPESGCELIFCGSACGCFNQSLTSGYVFDGIAAPFYRKFHPLRATPSVDNRVTAHYFVTFDFNPPLRRRRQTFGVSERPRQLQDDLESPRQSPAKPNGIQVLRDEFGAGLEYVKHARCCPAERTESPVLFSWPETCGGTVTPAELCVDSAGRPALRRCSGSPLTGVQWQPVQFSGSRCASVSNVTTNLHLLSQVTVTTENLVTTTSELERLTSEPSGLVLQDLISATVTLENIQAGLGGREPQLTEDLVITQKSVATVVSQLMDVDRSTLRTATKLVVVGPRVVRSLEGILLSSSSGSAVNVSTSNVAARSGDFVGVFSSTKEIEKSSLQLAGKGVMRSSLFGVESALVLENKKPKVPVVFLVYRDGRLLESGGQRVTSQVVSALLPSELAETQLSSEVVVAFRGRPGQCAPEPVCSFWDVAASRWSTRGCWLEKIYNGSDVCRCNHLTNFARIFNYEEDVYLSETYHRTLDVITYVGSALSLFGLFLTMLTFVVFKKWRKLRGSQIVMHMSVALTGVYVTFLGGLAATEHHGACVCLSALLHFFLLATFGWMAVEAVFQYLRFVRVVGTYISKFMLKASILVWGGSLAPVVCVLAVRPHCYDGQERVCWMDFQTFYYALALPVLAVVVFNAVLFGLIVYALNCGRQKGLRTNQPERQLALRRLRVSVLTFVLLGLPWVFGLLAVREARIVLAVLFCVCSMLQGFAIFLLMVAGESGVRGLWRSLLAGRCCADGTEDGTSSPSKAAHTGTGQTSETSVSSRGGRQNTRL